MSDYLRLTHNLLVSLGGIPSPEIFDLKAVCNPDEPPKPIEFKTGDTKFEPTSFAFFQGTLTRAYIIGHIPQEGSAALPILYAIISSGVLVRNNGQLQPFFEPVVREVLLVSDNLDDTEGIINEHVESGLDIEFYENADSYEETRNNATGIFFVAKLS